MEMSEKKTVVKYLKIKLFPLISIHDAGLATLKYIFNFLQNKLFERGSSPA